MVLPSSHSGSVTFSLLFELRRSQTPSFPRPSVTGSALRSFLHAGVASFLLLLPLILLAQGQSGQINDIPLPALEEKHFERSLGSGHWLGQLAVALLLVRALSVRSPLWLKVWAVWPLFLLLATHVFIHMFRLRYLVFTLPAWALLLARSLDFSRADLRLRSWLTVGVAALMMSLGYKTQLKLRMQNARASSDYREAAQHVRAHAQPGDAIAFAGASGKLRHARLAMAYEFRHGPVLPDVFAARSMIQEGKFSAQECREPAACLSSSTERIWLVAGTPLADVFAGMPPARASLLRRDFEIAETRAHWHGSVLLLRRKSL
jgi:mannosyltransferase